MIRENLNALPDERFVSKETGARFAALSGDAEKSDAVFCTRVKKGVIMIAGKFALVKRAKPDERRI